MEPTTTPEPSTVSRPVMDVRPPRPVAPTQPEAPSSPAPVPATVSTPPAPASTQPELNLSAAPTLQSVSVKKAPADDMAADTTSEASSEPIPTTDKPSHKKPAPSKSAHAGPHAPIGLVTATIIVMAGLAAAAVAVYVNSQPGL